MVRLAISFAFAVALLSGAAFAQGTVDGTVKHASGLFEYTKISLKGTHSDQFFTYWVGSAKGVSAPLWYDPYNRIWVEGPISYTRSTLPFGNGLVEGWTRSYGDGSVDKRFFFGVDGHVYMRKDVFRKRKMQNNRRRKRLVYSYWMDLVTGKRSDWVYAEPGEAVPTQAEIEAAAAAETPAESFPNWKEADEKPVIEEEPLTEEEQLSLGAAIRQTISGG
ncbi:MAG: hypothetical protein HRF49_02010 [bacterium]|jgi:hypothetical protein